MNHLKDKTVEELEEYIQFLFKQIEVVGAYKAARKKLDDLTDSESFIVATFSDGTIKRIPEFQIEWHTDEENRSNSK